VHRLSPCCTRESSSSLRQDQPRPRGTGARRRAPGGRLAGAGRAPWLGRRRGLLGQRRDGERQATASGLGGDAGGDTCRPGRSGRRVQLLAALPESPRPHRLPQRVEERGIEVATVVSGDVRVDTADGRMLARILASIDQGEWERARERYMRKRQELIADGKWTGGHVGFGYRVEDGRLVVDEAKASLVRDAVRRLLNGESQGSIIRRWAAEGVRTRQRGRPWSLQTFSDLVQRDLPGILAEVDTERIRALCASRRTGPRREAGTCSPASWSAAAAWSTGRRGARAATSASMPTTRRRRRGSSSGSLRSPSSGSSSSRRGCGTFLALPASWTRRRRCTPSGSASSWRWTRSPTPACRCG
jgi:hypothetical protein